MIPTIYIEAPNEVTTPKVPAAIYTQARKYAASKQVRAMWVATPHYTYCVRLVDGAIHIHFAGPKDREMLFLVTDPPTTLTAKRHGRDVIVTSKPKANYTCFEVEAPKGPGE